MLEARRQPLPGFFIPRPDAPRQALPLDAGKISAGFPSPAADYEDKRLDINEYLVRHPVSTFFFPVQGESKQGAEIFDGDILVVNRSIRPCHDHIVVAIREWGSAWSISYPGRIVNSPFSTLRAMQGMSGRRNRWACWMASISAMAGAHFA